MSGIGRGGLGGAAPAYLQQTAAQEAADMAHKRRLNAARGDIEAKQREEAMGLGNEAVKYTETQRNTATEASSKLFAEQQRTLANQAAEVERNKNELARLEQSNANAIALAKAKEKFDASENALTRQAQMQIANMPPAEVKKFEYYFKNIFSKDPANQKMVGNRVTGYKRTDVPDDTLRAKAYIQMQKDEYAGYLSAIPEKAASALDVQESKNVAGDWKLKAMTDQWAKEKDPEKKMDLLVRINARKALLTNLDKNESGIGQGAPSAGSSDVPPPGAVRLKQ
jgi:hypothetical protein